MTVWFGARMISPDVGIVAGLMLAASPGVFGLARYAILDTLFTLFLFGGAALLATAALQDRPACSGRAMSSIAFAVLTKGPLALVLCGLTTGARGHAVVAICASACSGCTGCVGVAIVLVIVVAVVRLHVRCDFGRTSSTATSSTKTFGSLRPAGSRISRGSGSTSRFSRPASCRGPGC